MDVIRRSWRRCDCHATGTFDREALCHGPECGKCTIHVDHLSVAPTRSADTSAKPYMERRAIFYLTTGCSWSAGRPGLRTAFDLTQFMPEPGELSWRRAAPIHASAPRMRRATGPVRYMELQRAHTPERRADQEPTPAP